LGGRTSAANKAKEYVPRIRRGSIPLLPNSPSQKPKDEKQPPRSENNPGVKSHFQ
jgi:hypothetical protein